MRALAVLAFHACACAGCNIIQACAACVSQQVSGWQGARELHSDHGSVVVYRGMIDCFVRTVREEGIQALFKVEHPPHMMLTHS